jgi:hypothetical protein
MVMPRLVLWIRIGFHADPDPRARMLIAQLSFQFRKDTDLKGPIREFHPILTNKRAPRFLLRSSVVMSFSLVVGFDRLRCNPCTVIEVKRGLPVRLLF